jgi:hypothetical protein
MPISETPELGVSRGRLSRADEEREYLVVEYTLDIDSFS